MSTLNDSSVSFFKGEPSEAFKGGKTFRSFKLLNVTAGSTYVVRVNVVRPVYLKRFDISIDSGGLEVSTVAGGTQGGEFGETLPAIKLNLTKLTPYVVQTVVTAGGTHTGGTLIDIIRMKTDNNVSRGSSVITTDSSIRGIAPGVYYWRFNNVGADVAVGTVKIEWEEL